MSKKILNRARFFNDDHKDDEVTYGNDEDGVMVTQNPQKKKKQSAQSQPKKKSKEEVMLEHSLATVIAENSNNNNNSNVDSKESKDDKELDYITVGVKKIKIEDVIEHPGQYKEENVMNVCHVLVKKMSQSSTSDSDYSDISDITDMSDISSYVSDISEIDDINDKLRNLSLHCLNDSEVNSSTNDGIMKALKLGYSNISRRLSSVLNGIEKELIFSKSMKLVGDLGEGSFGKTYLYQVSDTNEIFVKKTVAIGEQIAGLLAKIEHSSDSSTTSSTDGREAMIIGIMSVTKHLQYLLREIEISHLFNKKENTGEHIILFKGTQSHFNALPVTYDNLVNYIHSNSNVEKMVVDFWMERAEGNDLFEYCGNIDYCNKGINKEQLGYVKKWALQICDAISIMHGLFNIIHRDLKTENLLLDKDNNIKMVDFGLSREGVGSEKSNGSTPSVAPREQRELGMTADAMSDVYSFAMALYDITLGANALPYASDTAEVINERNDKYNSKDDTNDGDDYGYWLHHLVSIGNWTLYKDNSFFTDEILPLLLRIVPLVNDRKENRGDLFYFLQSGFFDNESLRASGINLGQVTNNLNNANKKSIYRSNNCDPKDVIVSYHYLSQRYLQVKTQVESENNKPQ